MVRLLTLMPSLRSSPRMRSAPQVKFSSAMRRWGGYQPQSSETSLLGAQIRVDVHRASTGCISLWGKPPRPKLLPW